LPDDERTTHELGAKVVFILAWQARRSKEREPYLTGAAPELSLAGRTRIALAYDDSLAVRPSILNLNAPQLQGVTCRPVGLDAEPAILC
jgi:hypothetical protein